MTDPKRWLDEGGGATVGERELLEAGQNAKIPSALRERVWLGVATGAGGLAAVSEAAGAVGTGAVRKGLLSVIASSTLGKTVVAVGLVGGASLGVTAFRAKHAHLAPIPVSSAGLQAPPSAAPVIDEPTSTAQLSNNTLPVEETASALDTSPVVTPSQPTLVPSPTSKPHAVGPSRAAAASTPPTPRDGNGDGEARELMREAPPASRLREESAAVLAIRKTLIAGDPMEALRMLDSARTAFPNGILVEEREALAVRALVASAQDGLARRRGEAFLRAFPRSPHASDVRAAIGR